MSVRFVVPRSWYTLTDLTELHCEATTVGEAVNWFFGRYPDLQKRILADGAIAPWAIVSLDHVDVRSIGALDATIRPGDHEIALIGALMGG